MEALAVHVKAASAEHSEEFVLPSVPPNLSEVLGGRSIAIVDDDKAMVDQYGDLIERCGGRAVRVQYTNQTLDQLTIEVAKAAPDIVLLDFNLDIAKSTQINGGLLSRELAARIGRCSVLFSSVPIDQEEACERYQALGAALKREIECVQSLLEVVSLPEVRAHLAQLRRG